MGEETKVYGSGQVVSTTAHIVHIMEASKLNNVNSHLMNTGCNYALRIRDLLCHVRYCYMFEGIVPSGHQTTFICRILHSDSLLCYKSPDIALFCI